jgi:hypothetical protein
MKVLRHGKAIEMTDKTVWGAPQFADLALRLKAVEGRLDKLERPWVEARAQRQREIDAGKAAGHIIPADHSPEYAEFIAELKTTDSRRVDRAFDKYQAALTAREAAKKAVDPSNIMLEPKGQTTGAGDNRTVALNASITDLLEEIVRLEQSREELRLHVKAREGEIEQLRAANNQMLERLRAGAANFEKMLG